MREFLRGIDHIAGKLPGNERIHREVGIALQKIKRRGNYEMDDLEPLIRVLDRQRPFPGDLDSHKRSGIFWSSFLQSTELCIFDP